MREKIRKIRRTPSLALPYTFELLKALFRTLLLIGLSVVILYPLIYSLSVAFRPAKELYDPLVVLVPRTFVWDNMRNAIHYLDYTESLKNSIVLVAVCTLLQVLSCAMTGYGLARFHFRGSNAVFFMVVLTMIVPPQTVLIPTFMNFRFFDPFGLVSLYNSVTGSDVNINLVNTPFAFYLPAMFGSGIRSGVIIFIFRQFFRGLPKELEEAAYLDGCGAFRTFTRIMAPNAGGAFLITVLVSVVWYWNDYVYTSSLLSNYKTVMNQLYNLKNHIAHIMEYEVGASAQEGILILQAGVLLSILPPLLLYLLLQKYFRESVERSGIVG